MSHIDEYLTRAPDFIKIAFALAIAWKLPKIPSALKQAKNGLFWLSSKLWALLLEPKFKVAHSYYLKSLLSSPMRELGSSVQYRLITPSILRPELRDPIFGRDISSSALLTIVAGSTVKRIHFTIESTVGSKCTQDSFVVHTKGRSCEIHVVRPVYPLDSYTLFTSDPFIRNHTELVADVIHTTHLEHCFEYLTPTHDEFWRGEVVCRDNRCYNITAFKRAKNEIAETILAALLTPGEVTLSTNRENVFELRKLIRRGRSLRWDTPIRRAIATLLTAKPVLELIFWRELFQDRIDFAQTLPKSQLRWLAVFRLFRIDRVP